ncbi:winged helix-turn-helix domain-containing protein [Streptomyces sp. NPDC057798]|uniref:winged helix-turn-helix domain-containing protein n=1 Tax=Streptomyces sp. NPDC057798 TaxID=3346252 RepID=UPI0036C74860
MYCHLTQRSRENGDWQPGWLSVKRHVVDGVVVARRRDWGAGIPRPGRVALSPVPARPGETRRVSGPGPGRHDWVEDQVWTASRVASLIGRKFHVGYSSGVITLMQRLGLSPQVPARRVAERAEQAVAVWKAVTWAEGKESGRSAGDTCASRTRQASPADSP